jgi:ribosomal protein S18 acetylase RimI-like enzyme
LLPSLAARAIEENQWACFSRVYGDGFHEEGDLAWYVSGVLDPGLNGVFKATLRPDVMDERIEEALEPLRRRKLPMCGWVGPSSGPAGLGERLESHGLELEARPPGMAVELDLLKEPEPPEGLKIERVRDRKALAEWTRIVTSAFGIPVESSGLLLDLFDRVGYAPDSNLSSYVGVLGDEAVSSSTLFLEGEVAGIYNVATLPDARGRGIGAAMTLAPLKEARERGSKMGILQSSDMGYGVYRRLGFEQFCTLDMYVKASWG